MPYSDTLLAHRQAMNPGATPAEHQDGVRRDLDWLAGGKDRFLLDRNDPDYPALLAELPDPPAVLFCAGERQALGRPGVAVVGSRRATGYGRETANWLAAGLTGLGVAVISGLALGIDAAAHRGALKAGGSTLAVLGSGIDRIYPATNRGLAGDILGSGLVLSEYPTGTPAYPGNFPRRNRIVTGLAMATVVVEATQKSGSLISARLAGEQGRAVFAVPGPVNHPSSAGCHALIRDGATLVENARQVVADILPIAAFACSAETTALVSLPEAARRLLAVIESIPRTVDQLCETTGLPVTELLEQLLTLELDGLIEAVPGGYRRRAPPP